MSASLIFKNVEKQYGGLRPLRVEDLAIAVGESVMLLGLDRPAAETFVNLITGASLPDRGSVVSLGRPTSEIADSDEWLSFVERFGIVSDRIVLLDAMTVAQNLAISFDLQLEPIPPDVVDKITALAHDVELDTAMFGARVGEVAPLVRSQVYLARALALDPDIVVLEHPSASLAVDDARALAAIVKRVHARRRVTVVGLLADEKFAKTAGGRLLVWQPATGKTTTSRRLW